MQSRQAASVLIVDDNASDREIYRRFLQHNAQRDRKSVV